LLGALLNANVGHSLLPSDFLDVFNHRGQVIDAHLLRTELPELWIQVSKVLVFVREKITSVVSKPNIEAVSG